jgi:hypothetical protein
MNKIELIKDILKGMEYRDIRNGIWIITNDAYNDFFYHVHNGMLPDDCRYRMIHDILCNMDEDDEDLNIGDLIPVYTNELISWLNSNITRLSYCDQYLEEYDSISDTISLLSGGYMMELQEVYYLIVEWLNDNSNEEE